MNMPFITAQAQRLGRVWAHYQPALFKLVKARHLLLLAGSAVALAVYGVVELTGDVLEGERRTRAAL